MSAIIEGQPVFSYHTMNKAHISLRWLLLAALTQLTACGLKGPLYMPEAKPEAQADMVKQALPSSSANATSAAVAKP